jgi:hypothetical protein
MSERKGFFNWWTTAQPVPIKEEPKSIYTIFETSPSRQSRDIKDFVDALKSAERENIQDRVNLYDIYQESIDYDAHLRGLIDRRVDNIVNKDIKFMVNDKEDEKWTDWATAPKFRDFLRDVLMTKFWGLGLFEFSNDKDKRGNKGWFGYYKIPIKHFNPFKKEVLKRQTDSTGTPVANRIGRDLCLVTTDKKYFKDFGLLKTLTPLCIRKRNAQNSFDNYLEHAGSNFMALEYRNTSMTADPKKRAEIQEAIKNAKAGKPFMKPSGFDVQVTNMSSSQQNQLFELALKYYNEEQSKLVLGQTMTTEDGSSYSQAGVHERVQAEVFAADDKFIIDFLNYEFYEFHGIWGIPDGEWMFEENSSVKEIQEINKDMLLKSLGYKFTVEQIAEKYGLEKPTEENKPINPLEQLVKEGDEEEEEEVEKEETEEEEDDNEDSK